MPEAHGQDLLEKVVIEVNRSIVSEEKKLKSLKTSLTGNSEQLKTLVLNESPEVPEQEDSLDDLFDIMAKDNCQNLLAKRKNLHSQIQQLRKHLDCHGKLSRFLQSLFRSLQTAQEVSIIQGREEFENHNSSVDEIMRLYSTQLEPSLATFKTSVSSLLQFEQSRLRDSSKKLEDNKEEERKHLALYENQELVSELQAIRRRIQDFSAVVTRSETRLNNLAKMCFQLFCAILSLPETKAKESWASVSTKTFSVENDSLFTISPETVKKRNIEALLLEVHNTISPRKNSFFIEFFMLFFFSFVQCR